MNRLDWTTLAGRVDAMTLRERAMIFAALVLVIVLPAYAFVIEPAFKTQRELLARIHQNQSQAESARREIQKLLGASDDAVAGEGAKLRALQARIAQTEKAIETAQGRLVAPQRIPELLRDVLARHGDVKLVSLRVVPGAPVGATPAPAPAGVPADAKSAASPAQAAFYRHGLEIAVRGDYFALLRYIADLEKLPWALIWGDLAFEVRRHPEIELRFTLYTLSGDPAPIRI